MNRILKSVVRPKFILLLILAGILASVFHRYHVKEAEIKGQKKVLSSFVKTESLLVPKNLTSVEARKNLACFVTTSPARKEQRNIIRQTWGQRIKPIFILGRGDFKTLLEVAKESKIHNDIFIEDFEDSDENFTVKVAFIMKNFVKYFKGSQYLAKVNDDAVVNVENLYKFLKTSPKDKIIQSSSFSYTKFFKSVFAVDHSPGGACLIPG